MQRRDFLGAGAAGALALAGCGSSGGSRTATTAGGVPAGTPGAPDDGAILGFMLGLEQLQSDLYHRAQPFFRGSELELIKTLADQEDQHVARLTAALKSRKRPIPRAPKLRTPPTDRNSALALAYRLENLTASAYLGQVHRVVDTGVLGLVLAIQSVEGRHAAAVGALTGKTATPDGAITAGHNMAAIDKVLSEVAA